ncbi:response regulator [uncultured Sphingomonas sp.]|uniref:response regulator n=1 Tax=uncultured Sphingomonas sp. TaxID=158754 RepID=UPI003749E89A
MTDTIDIRADYGAAFDRGTGIVTLFRLLIVDDHPIVLTGLTLLLEGNPRFAIVATATSIEAAHNAAERSQPDVIVTDLALGEGDGIALIEDLRTMRPEARIIVYSASEEIIWGPRTIRAGAHGYVAKAEPLEAVALALDRVTAGAIHVSDAVQQALLGDVVRERDRRSDIDGLSARELQVLRLIGSGATLQSLAQQLQISVKTVGTYRERLKIKLGLDSARMLERYAADHAGPRTGAR